MGIGFGVRLRFGVGSVAVSWLAWALWGELGSLCLVLCGRL